MRAALIVAGLAALLLIGTAMVAAFPRTAPPAPVAPAPVCAPVADTYAGDGDPAGRPCDGG